VDVDELRRAKAHTAPFLGTGQICEQIPKDGNVYDNLDAIDEKCKLWGERVRNQSEITTLGTRTTSRIGRIWHPDNGAVVSGWTK
jgi:hypothetical protein